MRFAYADPPYLGQARHYRQHPEAAVWDDPATHEKLIIRLGEQYPDGWALSCSSSSLKTLLPMCPDDVRIGAWVKPFHVFKKGVRPAYAWEPVLFRGGRNKNHPPPAKGGKATTPKDFVSANITLKKGLTGAKPEIFCEWVINLLNVLPGDTLDDLFPGTGAMSKVTATRLEVENAQETAQERPPAGR
jgi:hypothetical protein